MKHARTTNNKASKEDKWLSVEERNESIDDWRLMIIWYLDLGFSSSVIAKFVEIRLILK
jgi:hypothetical protein